MSQNSQEDGQMLNVQNYLRIGNKRRSSILKPLGNKEERDERRGSRRISFSNNLLFQELKADGTTTIITEPYKEKKEDIYEFNYNLNNTNDNVPIIENERRKDKRRSFQNYLLQRYDENNHNDYTTIYNTLANRKGKLSIPNGTKVDVLTLFKLVENSDISNVNKENEFVDLSNINKSFASQSMEITDLKSNETFIQDYNAKNSNNNNFEKINISEAVSSNVLNIENQTSENMSVEDSDNFFKQNIITERSCGQTFLSTNAMSLENSSFQSDKKILITNYNAENSQYIKERNETCLTNKSMSLEASNISEKTLKDKNLLSQKSHQSEYSFLQKSIQVFDTKNCFSSLEESKSIRNKTFLSTKDMSIDISFNENKSMDNKTVSSTKSMSLEDSNICNDFSRNKTLFKTINLSLENSIQKNKLFANISNSKTKDMSLDNSNDQNNFLIDNTNFKINDLTLEDSTVKKKLMSNKTLSKTQDMSLEESFLQNTFNKNNRDSSIKTEIKENSLLEKNLKKYEKSNLLNQSKKNESFLKISNNQEGSFSQNMSLEYSIPKNNIQIFVNEESFHSTNESIKTLNDQQNENSNKNKSYLSPKNLFTRNSSVKDNGENTYSKKNILIDKSPDIKNKTSETTFQNTSKNKSSFTLPSQSIIDTVENVINKVDNLNGKLIFNNSSYRLNDSKIKMNQSIKISCEKEKNKNLQLNTSLKSKMNSPLIIKENCLKKNIKTIDVFSKLNTLKSNESNSNSELFEKKIENQSNNLVNKSLNKSKNFMFPVIIQSSKNKNETYSIINNTIKRIPTTNLSAFKNSRKISNLSLKEPIRFGKKPKLCETSDINHFFSANKTFNNLIYETNHDFTEKNHLKNIKVSDNIEFIENVEKNDNSNSKSENDLRQTFNKSQNKNLEINEESQEITDICINEIEVKNKTFDDFKINKLENRFEKFINENQKKLDLEKEKSIQKLIDSKSNNESNTSINSCTENFEKTYVKLTKNNENNKKLDLLEIKNDNQKTFVDYLNNKNNVNDSNIIKKGINNNTCNNLESINLQRTFIKSQNDEINEDINLIQNKNDNLQRTFEKYSKNKNQEKFINNEEKNNSIENLNCDNNESKKLQESYRKAEKSLKVNKTFENSSILENVQNNYIQLQIDDQHDTNMIRINNDKETIIEKIEVCDQFNKSFNSSQKIEENYDDQNKSIKITKNKNQLDIPNSNLTYTLNNDTSSNTKITLNSSPFSNEEFNNLSFDTKVCSPIESSCNLNNENANKEQLTDINNDSNNKLEEFSSNDSDKKNSTFVLFNKLNCEVDEMLNKIKNESTIDFSFNSSNNNFEKDCKNNEELDKRESVESSFNDINKSKACNSTMNIFLNVNLELDEVYKKISNTTNDVFDELLISLDEDELKNYFDKFNKSSYILNNFNGNCKLQIDLKESNPLRFNEIQDINIFTEINQTIKISRNKIWHLNPSEPTHKNILLITKNYIDDHFKDVKNSFISKFSTTQYIQELIDETEKIIKIAEYLALDLYISNLKYPCEFDLNQDKVIATYQLFGVFKEIKVVLPFKYNYYLQKPIIPKLKIFYDEKKIYPINEIRYVTNKIDKSVTGYIFKILQAIDEYTRKKSRFFRNKILFSLD